MRWLNHAVEKIWPICMEQIASEKILGPIIPWFLDKYRPWTAVGILVKHILSVLYLFGFSLSFSTSTALRMV